MDGAYGGSGIFAPSLRAKYRGLEQADSFILRSAEVAVHALRLLCAAVPPAQTGQGDTHPARVLPDVIHTSDGEWNPTDYAYHLTRRARGLPLWFSLAVNGIDAYREPIEVAVRLAKQTAGLITATPHLELIRESDLGVVLFRRTGWQPADYDSWAQALHDAGNRLHPADQMGGRNRRPVRVPAPAHHMDLVREILDRTK